MSSQSNKSLIDGLSCLNTISSLSEPVGCRELARLMNMNVTRVNRILMTLEEEGVLLKNANRKYMPGPGVFVLASQSLFSSSFFKRALAVIESIGEKPYTLALGVYWKKQISYVFHGKPGKNVFEGVGNLTLNDAFRSSIGHVVLGHMDDELLIKEYDDKELEINDLGTVQREKIKDQGYSCLEHDSRSIGKHYSIAVNMDSMPYIGLAFTAVPLDSDIDLIGAELKTIANQIEIRE